MNVKLKHKVIVGGKVAAYVIAFLALYAINAYFNGALTMYLAAFYVMFIVMSFEWKIEMLKEQIGVENLHDGGRSAERFVAGGLMRFGGRTPILPEHERSKPIPESGYGVNDGTHLFWKAFAGFGVIANKMLKHTPWRLQELSNSEVGEDGPAYGRRYSIYHGPNVAGLLLISDGKFSLANPEVHVRYEIRRARTYSIEDIRSFSGWMTDLLLTGREKETADQIRAEMMVALWQIGSVALRNPDINFSMKGEAKFYVAEAQPRTKAA